MITAVTRRRNDIEEGDLGGRGRGGFASSQRAASGGGQSCRANGSQGCFPIPNLVTSPCKALARLGLRRHELYSLSL